MKVEFIRTAFDTALNKHYKCGVVIDVEDEVADKYIKIGVAYPIVENVVAAQVEQMKAEEEEKEASTQDLIEEAVEEALVAQEKALNLKTMTVKELKEFAKENGITVKAKAKKDEIIATIMDSMED